MKQLAGRGRVSAPYLGRHAGLGKTRGAAATPLDGSNDMTLNQLQELIRTMYGAKDSARGPEGTFMWFMEEDGELSAALRGGSAEEQLLEFATVLDWLATLANLAGVDYEHPLADPYR